MKNQQHHALLPHIQLQNYKVSNDLFVLIKHIIEIYKIVV